ncbi:MAG: class I SAM-dependent methyltransferase [Bacteriovoracaceae bacterium]|jgi:hypothetical protein|nr:class I SAM-dependent methyltransferase [Bacteriovoracaceae bacterium]
MVPFNNHLENKFKLTAKQSIASKLFPIFKHFFPNQFWYWRKILPLPIFDIELCTDCGHGHHPLNISEKVLRDYYTSNYWYSAGETVEADDEYLTKLQCIEQFEFIQDSIPSSITEVLEIGGAHCHFSQLLRHHWKVQNLHVVEPGERWNDYYKTIRIEKISDFFPCDTQKKFDYIHTSHWLEHVSGVKNTLGEISQLLKDRGFLFIEVPNCNSEYWEVDTGVFPHLEFFTKESMTFFLEEHFNVIVIDNYGDDHLSINTGNIHQGKAKLNEKGQFLRVLAQKKPI